MKESVLVNLKCLEVFKQFPGFPADALFALSDLYAQNPNGLRIEEVQDDEKTQWMIYTGPNTNRALVILVTARATREASFTHAYDSISFEVRRKNSRYYDRDVEKYMATFTENGKPDPYNSFRFTYTSVPGSETTRRTYRLSEAAVMRPAQHNEDGTLAFDPTPQLPVQDDKYYHYMARPDSATGVLNHFDLEGRVTNYPGDTRPSAPELVFDVQPDQNLVYLTFSAETTQISVPLPQTITQTDMYHQY